MNMNCFHQLCIHNKYRFTRNQSLCDCDEFSPERSEARDTLTGFCEYNIRLMIYDIACCHLIGGFVYWAIHLIEQALFL